MPKHKILKKVGNKIFIECTGPGKHKVAQIINGKKLKIICSHCKHEVEIPLNK